MQEFYTLYADHLTAVGSRYIVDRDDLKDVFQDALINILSHISAFEYRGPGSLKAWASRIVVNEALDFLKARKHHEMMMVEEDIADEPYEETLTLSDIPPDVIQRMVKKLPIGYRTVFNLYVFENKSHSEISRLLGIKESTSSSQYNKAKALLANMIRQYINKEQQSRWKKNG